MSNLYKALRQKYGYDFQIPIYNDRAFKSLVKKHKNFIIKLLSELCNFNIKDVEDSYFLDTETNNKNKMYENINLTQINIDLNHLIL